MHYLIWLDINANNDELIKDKLKSVIICQLLTFDNVCDCEKYIFQNPATRCVFIVSYELGFVITPKIASLKQIVAIIVYSSNIVEDVHQTWIEEYSTVCVGDKFHSKKKYLFLISESSISCGRFASIASFD